MPNCLEHPRPVRVFFKIVVPAAILAVYVGIAFFCSRSLPVGKPYASVGGRLNYAKAAVISVDNGAVAKSEFPDLYTGSQMVTIRLLNGQLKGRTFQISNVLNSETNYLLKAGQKIIISVSSANGRKPGLNVFMYTPYRSAALLLLLLLFVAALCLVGGWRGVPFDSGNRFYADLCALCFSPHALSRLPAVAATVLLCEFSRRTRK